MILGNVCGHYVAIRPDLVKKDESESIIALIDKTIDRDNMQATTGIVVSVGENAWRAYKGTGRPWAKVGDEVIFVRNASKYIDIEDELDERGKPHKLFIMEDENVLWRISEGKLEKFGDDNE